MKIKIPELAVIIPVYNEEGIIREVIEQWYQEFCKLEASFKIHIYDDGSQDQTLTILRQLEQQYSSLIVHCKSNSGHGPTILQGYLENIDAKWIFQVDSDNEMEAKYFKELWNYRNEYDFILGRRQQRNQNMSRAMVSWFSQIIINNFYGKGICDVNAPYRLLRTDKFKPCLYSLPLKTFAPNVIITGYANLMQLKSLEVFVSHNDRQSGQVSLKKFKLFKAAILSTLQTLYYRFWTLRKINKLLSSQLYRPFFIILWWMVFLI